VAAYDAPNNGPESIEVIGQWSFGTITVGGTAMTTSTRSVFVWKLNADGTTAKPKDVGALVGNGSYNLAGGIAIDGQGNPYVAGTSNLQLFVARLDPASLMPTWISYFTHRNTQNGAEGFAVAVDQAGHVYTTGTFTGTYDFDPGPGKYLLTSCGSGKSNLGDDCYVSELNANDGGFIAAADLHGTSSSSTSLGYGIAVDSSSPGSSNVYTTGQFLGSVDFDPTAGARVLTSNTGGGSSNYDAFVVKLTQSSPLLAAGGPAARTKAAQLTEAALRPIMAAAIDRWATAGLSAAQIDVLRHASVTIADLGSSYLGLADASTHAVRVDDDAAGYGWFVDATPRDDAEFRTPGDKRVRGWMDLLSVVAHELGHLIGLDDDRDAAHTGDVMGDALSTGTRRMPTVADVSNADSAVNPHPGVHRPILRR